MDEKLLKGKPKRTRKMTKAEQSERFKETARRIGMSEDREEFERAFRKIASPKRHQKPR